MTKSKVQAAQSRVLSRSPAAVLVEIQDLTKKYRGRSSPADARDVVAVDGVSLQIFKGETLGIVGESGSGKSTIARILVGLERPTAGRVRFDGVDIHDARKGDLHRLRRRMQLVFQDPRSSLNRRKTVSQSIAAPLIVHGIDRKAREARVRELLELVGLNAAHLSAYPSELSGGQAQRVAIARALSLEPDLVVLDEAVSSLDVSIQAQILNLLKDLQVRLGLTYLFIAHDLSIVHFMADHIAVMYAGRVVETAGRQPIFSQPKHPYTHALLAAIPEPVPGQGPTSAYRLGESPAPHNLESGCAFRPRCPVGRDKDLCRQISPALVTVASEHSAACHLPKTRQEFLSPDRLGDRLGT